MTLDIFGKKFKVVTDLTLLEQGYEGFVNLESLVITIGYKRSDPNFMSTLIHELVHTVLFRTGVMQTSISLDLQEIICENISQALVENFKIRQRGKK